MISYRVGAILQYTNKRSGYE